MGEDDLRGDIASALGDNDGDSTEVVANHVHDHHVLGAVLLRCAQRLAARTVLRGPEASRPRALHRAAHDAVTVDAEEELG